MVLLRCNDKECRGQRVWLSPLDAEIQLLGVIDLLEPGALGESRGIGYARPEAWVEIDYWKRRTRPYGWPALAIALRSRKTETTTSHRLARGDRSGPLDVIASEQRLLERSSLCLPPKPVEFRYLFVNGRYDRRREGWDTPGCH